MTDRPRAAKGHFPYPARTLAEVAVAEQRAKQDAERRRKTAVARTWEDEPAPSFNCSLCWRDGKCVGAGCPIAEAA